MGAGSWNSRDLHPQGHLTALSSLGVSVPWVWCPPLWLSWGSGKPVWARWRDCQNSHQRAVLPHARPSGRHCLCVSDCVDLSDLNVCVCVVVYNDCVSILLCVSLGGGVWLGQSVYVVAHFCAHLGPPIPTPGGSVFITPRVPGKDKSTASLCMILTL